MSIIHFKDEGGEIHEFLIFLYFSSPTLFFCHAHPHTRMCARKFFGSVRGV